MFPDRRMRPKSWRLWAGINEELLCKCHMTNTETLASDQLRSMTEPHNQQLQKIRAYLLDSIALAANEIAEIDELLKQN